MILSNICRPLARCLKLFPFSAYIPRVVAFAHTINIGNLYNHLLKHELSICRHFFYLSSSSCLSSTLHVSPLSSSSLTRLLSFVSHPRLRLHDTNSRHTVLDCMCGCVCGSTCAPAVAAPTFPMRIPIVCNSTGSDDQDGNDTGFQIAIWPLMLAWPSLSAAPEVSSTGCHVAKMHTA